MFAIDTKSLATGVVLTLATTALASKLGLFPSPPASTLEDEDSGDESDGFDDDDDDDDQSPPSIDPKQWGVRDAPYKLVLCVNKTLKMTPGKQAAQCCHAAVGCFKNASKAYPYGLKCWETTGCAKVCVKLPTEVDQDTEFNKIRKACKERGVACYLVEDAGRTQIAPGSRTVIGVGPAPVSVIDEICSEYKLL
jgi:peptidyl-tRNA hydrolase